jgi:hypothetical protein
MTPDTPQDDHEYFDDLGYWNRLVDEMNGIVPVNRPVIKPGPTALESPMYQRSPKPTSERGWNAPWWPSPPGTFVFRAEALPWMVPLFYGTTPDQLRAEDATFENETRPL